MTALAHFMGLACIIKWHSCGDGRAELAGFNQGRYFGKLICVRLNRYHEAPNAVALAGTFRRLTECGYKPAAWFGNFVRSVLCCVADGFEDHIRKCLPFE